MIHSSLLKSYPYNPKATTSILCILFFGASAAVLVWEAATNDRGLILNGVFRLSESAAATSLWILSGLSVAFVRERIRDSGGWVERANPIRASRSSTRGVRVGLCRRVG